MAKVTAKASAAKWRDRRSGQERRRQDGLNPQGRERRRSIEPRKPEVQELEMSLEEWQRLHVADPVEPTRD